MDTGGIEFFVTGSSARLLSRKVATSLRGRAMEVLVHPFSRARARVEGTASQRRIGAFADEILGKRLLSCPTASPIPGAGRGREPAGARRPIATTLARSR